MHGARNDTERARGTSTTPPSAAHAARRTHVGRSRWASPAAPEAWHRAGTAPQAGTDQWQNTAGAMHQALHMPRDAMLTRLSSCRLLAMALPHLDARQKLLI